MSYAQETTSNKFSGMKPRVSRRSIRNSSAMTNHSPLTLILQPLNDTFATKTFELPDKTKIRIGRQTNPKTVPSENNGFFDSKVLSRTHAEVWSDRGKLYIKDLKSSNGTFINSVRLSQESVESDAFELHNDDILEFGIDIAGDDGHTIMYQKVAARVFISGTASDGRGTSTSEEALQKRGGPKSGTFMDMINSTLEYELQHAREESSRLAQLRTNINDFGITLEEKNLQVQTEETAELKRQLQDYTNQQIRRDFGDLERSLMPPKENVFLLKKIAEAKSQAIAQKDDIKEQLTQKESQIQILLNELEQGRHQLSAHTLACDAEKDQISRQLTDKFSREKAALVQQIEETRTLYDTHLKECNAKKDMNVEVGALQTRCQKLKETLDETLKEKHQLQEQVKQNHRVMQDLEKAREKLSRAESQFNDVQSELENTKARLKSMQSEKEAAAEKFKDQLADIMAQHKLDLSEQNAMKKENEQLNAKIVALHQCKKNISGSAKDSEWIDKTSLKEDRNDEFGSENGISSTISSKAIGDVKPNLSYNDKGTNNNLGSPEGRQESIFSKQRFVALVSFLSISYLCAIILYIYNYMRRSTTGLSFGAGFTVLAGIGLYTYYKFSGK